MSQEKSLQKTTYEQRTWHITAGVVEGQNKLDCGPHMHHHIELVYLARGRVSAIIDFKRHEASAGDAIFVFPNQVHRFISHSEDETSVLVIAAPDITPEYSDIFQNLIPSSPIVKKVSKNDAMVSLFSLLSDHRTARGELQMYAEEIIRGSLLALYGLLFKRMTFGKLSSDNNAAREILSYCSTHFSENISLELLETELHLSKFYISHVFSQKLEIGFCDYINSLRISEAGRLLRETDLKITDISGRVGFNTPRTFNRAFLKFNSLSPLEYRKKYRYVSEGTDEVSSISETDRYIRDTKEENI